MNTITDRDEAAPVHICKLITGVFCLLSVIFVICYGMFLAHTVLCGQDGVVQLAPEQTVLFYQPDLELNLAPLADVPHELEYINHARHLA